ncbi:MAG TPA: DUF4105 domain-containing protein [Longimicrobiales bacterium]|nr:DUF4105 domain-containing protein [Longimicrobiales bacterium]
MKLLLTVLLVIVLGFVGMRATAVPRGARTYIPEHEAAARIEFRGDSVHLDRVRDFSYAGDSAVARDYQVRGYRLADARAVWYGLSPFASWRGPAHAFLSFEFADSSYLVVSVEARRERGESFSPIGGLLRRYELHYVIGSEPDVIGLRTSVWGDPVYLYPTTADAEQARQLLEAVLIRAAGLEVRPEYYNTLTNNCATNLAAALNRVAPKRAPWRPALFLPGFSDTYAWRRGLLALDASPAQVRERYRIDDRARSASRAEYSRRIRAFNDT